MTKGILVISYFFVRIFYKIQTEGEKWKKKKKKSKFDTQKLEILNNGGYLRKAHKFMGVNKVSPK
jgi:hypothetical protein